MTDADTARRERAERSLRSEDWTRSDENYEWARGYSLYASDRGFLHGYLAGAREEAARAAAKLRAAAAVTRTPFGEQLRRLTDEIEEGA